MGLLGHLPVEEKLRRGRVDLGGVDTVFLPGPVRFERFGGRDHHAGAGGSLNADGSARLARTRDNHDLPVDSLMDDAGVAGMQGCGRLGERAEGRLRRAGRFVRPRLAHVVFGSAAGVDQDRQQDGQLHHCFAQSPSSGAEANCLQE